MSPARPRPDRHRPPLPPASQPAAFAAIPGALARRLGVLPLRLEAGVLHVAVEPGSLDGDGERRLTAARLAAGVVEVVAQEHPGTVRRTIGLTARHRLAQLTAAPDVDAVGVLDALLDDAVTADASDLHVDAGTQGVQVRLRIDGSLHARDMLPAAFGAPLLARIKVLARLDAAQRRGPQDGRFTHVLDSGTDLGPASSVDVRVATIATRQGERATLRLLPQDATADGLDGLGLPSRVVAALTRAGHAGDGLILVGGPTGSGKTTTLHALLRTIATGPRHVMTLEDPVERIIAGVSQTQVDPSAGITFETGLRHLLRHDPDVLLIGEVRDGETARLAVEAAHTGHLVLASLHAVDAPGAVDRLIELGAPRSLVVDALRVVVAQRLLPLPCPDCAADHPLPTGGTPSCSGCDGTTSRGRSALAEVLEPDADLRMLLRHAPDAPATLQAVATACAPRLRDVGAAHVRAGRARAADVRRATPGVGAGQVGTLA